MNVTGPKKYGLQIRAPPPSSKKPLFLKKPSVFADDADESDNIEEDIARQASKQKTVKDVEQQHKLALEEDPTVFDYDAVYDDMKRKSTRSPSKESANSQPKYITKLIEKAKVRQQEQEIIYERKLAKERTLEDHLYGDKDKYVTSAYKKKLAEQAKWLEEERLRELREQAQEVTKRSDLSDFYRNLLNKNFAFGGESTKAQDKAMGLHESPQPQKDVHAHGQIIEPENECSVPDMTLHSEQDMRSHALHKEVEKEAPNGDYVETTDGSSKRITETSQKEKSSVAMTLEKQEGTSDKISQADRKPNEDALAAAKERYLTRKRMRES